MLKDRTAGLAAGNVPEQIGERGLNLLPFYGNRCICRQKSV